MFFFLKNAFAITLETIIITALFTVILLFWYKLQPIINLKRAFDPISDRDDRTLLNSR